MTTPRCHSPMLADIHEDAQTLHSLGLADKTTMRRFDELCLVAVQPMTSQDIRTLREREGVSQPVLAWHLNVSKNIVSEWERGTRKPGGAALKLLNLVREKGLQSITL